MGGSREVEHLFAGLRQEIRFPAALRRIAQHSHGFSAVEVGIAGGAVAHAPAEKFIFSRQGFGGHDPRSQNHGAAFDHFFRRLDGEVVTHGVDGGHLLFGDGNVHAFQVV